MTEIAWPLYSKKLQKRIQNRYHVGVILEEQPRPPEMRWVMGESSGHSIWCKLYIIIDTTDGIIVDTKFQTFAPPVVIGLMETLCSLLMRKNYRQAMQIGEEFLQNYLRDSSSAPRFPANEKIYLPTIVESMHRALNLCSDIELSTEDIQSPIGATVESSTIHTDFLHYSDLQKRSVLESVIEKEVSPFIALDEGGIEILSIEGSCITIRYLGSCTSCPAATGSTLHAIESILKHKVHPTIQVIPDLEPLTFPE